MGRNGKVIVRLVRMGLIAVCMLSLIWTWSEFNGTTAWQSLAASDVQGKYFTEKAEVVDKGGGKTPLRRPWPTTSSECLVTLRPTISTLDSAERRVRLLYELMNDMLTSYLP